MLQLSACVGSWPVELSEQQKVIRVAGSIWVKGRVASTVPA